MILDTPDLDADAFTEATGWRIEPQGACRGDVCVPLGDGDFDLADTAARLGMALVHDEANRLWALGPETLDGRALHSSEVPDLVFDTLDGGTFELASLRGQKVVLVAWAPY